MTFETLATALAAAPSVDIAAHGDFLSAAHPADIAHFLKDKGARLDWLILDQLSLAKQAEVLGYLERGEQVALARSAPRARLCRDRH